MNTSAAAESSVAAPVGQPTSRTAASRLVLADLAIAALALFAAHSAPHPLVADWLPRWIAWPGALWLAGVLLLRRRAPLLVVCLVAPVAAAMMAIGLPIGGSGSALLAAVYAVGAYADGHRAAAGVLVAEVAAVAGVGATLLGDLPWGPTPTWSAAWPVFLLAVFGVAAAGVSGYALRTRRAYVGELKERAARLEREQGQLARQAVDAERLRIARELHDIIGHSISVITIHSEAAARSLASNPAAVPGFLATITATGREALTEMRHLLAVLRPEEGGTDALRPQPDLGVVPELTDRIAAAGVPVEVSVSGSLDELPAGVSLAAFRVLQEALTNVIKHAGPDAQARVTISRDPGLLRLSVSDNGRGPSGAATAGAHGMIGMRERVSVYAGDFQAGPGVQGGFQVSATFELDPEQG